MSVDVSVKNKVLANDHGGFLVIKSVEDTDRTSVTNVIPDDQK